MGEFFQGGEGIRFEEGKGVELKKMAQGEKAMSSLVCNLAIVNSPFIHLN